MEKSRAIELLKLAVPIKALTQQEYADFVEAVNMGMDALEQPTSPDTIDRKAALDALAKIAREKFNLSDEYNHYLAGLMDGELAIKGLPTIQPEPQWIPVERELPEDFTDVLVWFEYFRYGDYNCLYQTHGIGTYVANYNLWTVNHETGWKDLRVIAWMPLPEPYKPNNE